MEPTQNSSSSKLQNPSTIPLENSPWTSHFYPAHHHHHPSSMFFSSNHHHHHHNFNLNHDEDVVVDEVLEDQASTDNNTEIPITTNRINLPLHEREPMFEKPLTPSDVGKLNRLVIPKQHAEKYFPLGGGGGDSGDKGLLLSFEDESGKFWRFRYSYWNSSQSYVLTKGWSRYVKEKQLDAGDIILFERHRSDGDRLFIGWRRRGAAVAVLTAAAATLDVGGNTAMAANSSGGGVLSNRGLYQQGHPYLGHIQGHGANVPYQPDCLHAGSMVQNQAPVVGNPRRLVRLFGVNLECQLDESEPSTPDSSSVSSHSQGGPNPHQPFYNSHSYTSNYMDITFSQDMRNHRG